MMKQENVGNRIDEKVTNIMIVFISVIAMGCSNTDSEHFDQNGNNKLIDMDDVNMTADEAVQKAKDYGLVGGNPNEESHWVSGYNFKMSYASLASSPNDYRIFLEEIEYSDEDVEWKSF